MPKKRKGQAIPLKPVLHIFCEGEKTEPNYLNGYLDLYHPGTRLVMVAKTPKNTPVQLVDVAVDAKKMPEIIPKGICFGWFSTGSHRQNIVIHCMRRRGKKQNGTV